METSSAQEKIPGTFESFDDALAACDGTGYDDKQIADVVLWKTRIYRALLDKEAYPKLTANQARQILGLSLSIKNNRLSVLDFGGACGVHYFLAKKIFGDTIDLNWTVVETPSMCSKAREFESDELRFFDSIDAATDDGCKYDLTFISGSLQYVPDPYQTFDQLIACESPHLFLTRTALSTTDREYILIHESTLGRHGRGGPLKTAADVKTQCPVVIARRDKIEEILSVRYKVVMEFTEAMESYKVGETAFHQYGYYCRLR